jgi:hypothetical protein
VHNMIPVEWEDKITSTIQQFPSPYNKSILGVWEEWLKTDPESPFYENWTDFSSARDDEEALFTETRVYFKRVANELREREVPPTSLQKIAKALAAVASIFLVIFLAISRVARASD